LRASFHSSTQHRADDVPAKAEVTGKFKMATSNQSIAEEQATKLLHALPGKTESDKAQNFVLGTAAAAILLGKEIIPYTGDVVYMLPFTAAMYVLFQQVGPFMGNTYKAIIAEQDKIWAESKQKAVVRLESEIHSITGSGITELADVTQGLFEHAKEVTKMEAEAFEHAQKVAYYTKAKQILDEWVRHETAVREREQKRIAEEVIAKVTAAIQDQKFVCFTCV
jgi:F-type H+-transporting ATPase subunit b